MADTSRIPTGRVAAGRHELEVGAAAGTLITSRADTGDPAELRRALEEKPSRRSASVVAGHLVDPASQATARAEEAVDLFTALVKGSLLEPQHLTKRVDLMLELLQRLDREGRHEEALRLARAVNGLLALAMRWADLVRSLRTALRAAEHLGDSPAVAWAHHELGTLHLAADDPAGAERLLAQAREIRQRLGDRDGLAATEHNLHFLCRRLRELVREGTSGHGVVGRADWWCSPPR